VPPFCGELRAYRSGWAYLCGSLELEIPVSSDHGRLGQNRHQLLCADYRLFHVQKGNHCAKIHQADFSGVFLQDYHLRFADFCWVSGRGGNQPCTARSPDHIHSAELRRLFLDLFSLHPLSEYPNS